MIKLLIYYFVVINLISFIVYALDKHKTQKQKWRISERNLLMLSFLGGSPAAFLAMRLFKHKIRKNRFRIGIPLIMFVQAATIFFIVHQFKS